jgi:pimeloyl-ACP methyl ester carboxylesterase
MKTLEHFIPNGDGWHLALSQTWDEARLDKGRRPVVIVPGYGMNSFIFSYHPRGPSLEGYLAQAGFEVWRVDLRAQGRSLCVGGGEEYGLEDLALTDLDAALLAVLDRSRTGADRADVIGASLGGTIMFLHAALHRERRTASLVAIGTPVRWVEIHPVLRLAFSSPTLIGMLPFRGTRRLAEIALPHLLKRTPWALSAYINADITDSGAASEMVKTVEDPNRHVNRQIARWIRGRDLIIKGQNLSTELRGLQNPLLCVLAHGDGIVPRKTAEYPYLTVQSSARRLLCVGSKERAMAHADLFVSNGAQESVFAPIAAWLAAPET